jgi:acid phosphatase family membrane protein YuiD
MFQTIGKTTSMVVAGTFFAVLAYQRDALMLSFFLGAILNGILSKVLKKIVNQERPVREGGPRQEEEELSPSDNGMPSSHAMSLGFICTFTAMQLPYSTIPLLLYVVISLWYRVETELHTLDQVLVGLVLGTMDSFLWRSLCFGTNPLFNNHINVMEWVTINLLNEQGVMPIYALTVPAIVGALVVGSVERRIQRFLQNRLKDKQE